MQESAPKGAAAGVGAAAGTVATLAAWAGGVQACGGVHHSVVIDRDGHGYQRHRLSAGV